MDAARKDAAAPDTGDSTTPSAGAAILRLRSPGAPVLNRCLSRCRCLYSKLPRGAKPARKRPFAISSRTKSAVPAGDSRNSHRNPVAEGRRSTTRKFKPARTTTRRCGRLRSISTCAASALPDISGHNVCKIDAPQAEGVKRLTLHFATLSTPPHACVRFLQNDSSSHQRVF
jgi:hypothetical protein